MKTLLSLLLFSFSLPLWAARDVDPDMIDHEWVKVIDRMDKAKQKQCSEVQNFAKKMACDDEVWFEFVKEGDVRGNEQYINKRYSNLDRAGLEVLISKWKVLEEKGRRSTDVPSLLSVYERGELSRNTISIELRALRSLLADRSPRRCEISMEDYIASIHDPEKGRCD